jgi:rhamnosyltransferase
MNTENSDNLTVIIRNKNEERWIGFAIQSVLDFFKRPEIIVVDNKSTDGSVDLVKHFIHDPLLKSNTLRYTDIKIINIENYTPGSAINLGVKHSTKDYILILSAHCVIKKINFEDLKLKLKKYVGIFGNQIPIWMGKKINKRYIWSHFKEIEEENMYSEMEDRHFFHNAASIFKKKCLLEHPFHQTLLGKEDRYWANERIDEGKNYLYDPSFEVEHYYTDGGNTWKGIG